jgi:hypothetical protein
VARSSRRGVETRERPGNGMSEPAGPVGGVEMSSGVRITSVARAIGVAVLGGQPANPVVYPPCSA